MRKRMRNNMRMKIRMRLRERIRTRFRTETEKAMERERQRDEQKERRRDREDDNDGDDDFLLTKEMRVPSVTGRDMNQASESVSNNLLSDRALSRVIQVFDHREPSATGSPLVGRQLLL